MDCKFCFYFLAIYLSLTDMLLLWQQRALAVSKKNWRMVSRGPSVMNPFCIDEIPAVVKTISKSPPTGAKWWGRPVGTSFFGPKSELCLALCLDDWLTSGDDYEGGTPGEWKTLVVMTDTHLSCVCCQQHHEHFLLMPQSYKQEPQLTWSRAVFCTTTPFLPLVSVEI